MSENAQECEPELAYEKTNTVFSFYIPNIFVTHFHSWFLNKKQIKKRYITHFIECGPTRAIYSNLVNLFVPNKQPRIRAGVFSINILSFKAARSLLK